MNPLKFTMYIDEIVELTPEEQDRRKYPRYDEMPPARRVLQVMLTQEEFTKIKMAVIENKS